MEVLTLPPAPRGPCSRVTGQPQGLSAASHPSRHQASRTTGRNPTTNRVLAQLRNGPQLLGDNADFGPRQPLRCHPALSRAPSPGLLALAAWLREVASDLDAQQASVLPRGTQAAPSQDRAQASCWLSYARRGKTERQENCL